MLASKDISFWFSELEENCEPRAALHQDINADVVIIGAGFTGLWTAYYLKQLKPELNIVIVEARIAGFGASGRNGGWLMGLIEDLEGRVSHLPLSERQAVFDEVHGLVDEVIRVTELEDIDCELAKGGAVYTAARFPEQLPWAKEYLRVREDAGHKPEDYYWMTAEESRAVVNVRDVYGAVYTPHVAAIQPAKLARGLACAVEKLDVKIYEQSAAHDIEPMQTGCVVKTEQGSVRADVSVLATEGFGFGFGSASNSSSSSRNGATKNPLNKFIIPIQSKIIATEVLNSDQWQELGFGTRSTLCDFSRLSTYIQRSEDGRLIFGARGVYEFGGKPMADNALPRNDSGFQLCERLMHDFFPSTHDVTVEHAWGGTFGMSRRFSPHVVFDEASGLATAGGYGGEGVGGSNLFGRTLAEVIAGKDSLRTQLPWVHRTPINKALRSWEPEPFRWLTYAAMAKMFDYEERLYGKPDASAWKKTLAGGIANGLSRILS